MTTSVSIIITAYNKAPYLRQSVESVLAQTHSEIDCLIVDDGSTDHTSAVVEQLLQEYPQVRYFYKDNGGISSARNFGLDQAKGSWVQFLDADDWIHPDKTRLQLASLTDLNQEAVVYSDYERVYVDGHDAIVNRKPLTIGSVSSENLVKRLLICPDFLASSPFPLLQQAMLFKRSLFERHRFDERLKACEDRDFVLELIQNHVRFVYVPMTAAYYRKYQGNLTDNGSLMLDAYLTYFELVQRRYPALKDQCQTSVRHLLNNSIEQRASKNFKRLLPLIQYPVSVIHPKLVVANHLIMRLVYALRCLTPSFLLYDRYRGPRSRQLIALGSRILKTLGVHAKTHSHSA